MNRIRRQPTDDGKKTGPDFGQKKTGKCLMPKVSVIVPVYNCEQYLRECIDSILAQTFGDFELILVDDGSSDNSGSIVDWYAAKVGRIRVIHKKNGGQSSARNAGLEAAEGEYICFADSDDIQEPDLLEKVIPRFGSGYEMVAFCFRTIPRGKRPDPSLVTVLQEEKKVFLNTDEERYAFLTGPFRRKDIRWELWNRVFRRDIIEKWNVRFPSDRGVYPEDMYFTYCYVAHISKILMIPDVLYEYRLRGDSVSDGFSKTLMISTSHLLAEQLYEHYRSSSDCRYLAEHYPAIYYLLHKGALRRLRRYQWRQELSMKQARKILKENVSDYEVFRRRMAEAYDDPAVAGSYRQDSGRLLQLTDRLYARQLLEIGGSGPGKTLERALLKVLRACYIKKIKEEENI